MRFITFIFALLFVINSNSQIVIDSETKELLPLVNISIKNTKKGFYSNKKGRFALPSFVKNKDTLLFTSINYIKKLIIYNSEKLIDTVFLDKKNHILEEIILTYKNNEKKSKKYKSIIIGITKKRTNLRNCHGSVGYETAVFIENDFTKNNVGVIKELRIKNLIVKYRSHFVKNSKIKNKVAIKLKLYKVNPFTKTPDSLLITEDIVLKINRNGNYKLDIFNKKIKMPVEGLFFGFEIVGVYNENEEIEYKEGNILCFRASRVNKLQTFSKYNDSKWIKTNFGNTMLSLKVKYPID